MILGLGNTWKLCIHFYSMLRVPLGQIDNRLFKTEEDNATCSSSSLGSSTQLSSQSSLQAHPQSTSSDSKARLIDFFQSLRDSIDETQAMVLDMVESAERAGIPFLNEGLTQKEHLLELAKHKIKSQLRTLGHFSFIDRHLFATGRSTGTIEIQELSGQNLTLASDQRYYSLDNIRGLRLSNLILTTVELEEICRTLPNLEELSLYECAVSSEGAKVIAKGLPRLVRLDLEWNQIGDEGAVAISQNLQELKSLNLYLNDVTDIGSKALIDNLKSLRNLNLINNNLSVQMQALIALQMGSVTILS